MSKEIKPEAKLLTDVALLIEQSRHNVALSVNAEITLLYWNVGKRINKEILNDSRAEYGKQIVYALRRQLSWTQLRTLIYMDDPLKREFYIGMCRIEKWSSRQLQERIQSMLYERTAISKKPEETIQNDLELLKTITIFKHAKNKNIYK